MESVAFALPVRPGQKQAMKKFASEHSGPHMHEFHVTHKRIGIHRVRVYLQHKPMEMCVVYIEGEDLAHSFARHIEEDSDFMRWFHDNIEKFTGHHPHMHGGELPSQLIVDWAQGR